MIDFEKLANTLGIPVAIMVVMAFAAWRGIRAILLWTAPRADKALESYEKTNEQHANSAEKSAEALSQLVPICDGTKRIIEKMDDGHERMAAKVDEIHTIVKGKLT